MVSGPHALADAVRRRIRILLVRQLLEQQAAALLSAAEGPCPDRFHTRVADRFLLLTSGVPESSWPVAYGLARLAGVVYRQTCAVLHGNRAFADVPEIQVQEWEQVGVRVRDAVAEREPLLRRPMQR